MEPVLSPDSYLSRPGPGEPSAEQATPARPSRKPGRRGLAFGAGAVLALTGTVLGVAAAGMPSGRGAVTGNAASGKPDAAGARPGIAPGRAGQARHGAPGAGQGAAGHSGAGGTAGQGTAARGSAGQGTAGQDAAGTARAGSALRTSCRSVAHIGDSTSADLISAAFLPDASQRLAARYRDVGVRHVRIDASGGRSIVEEMPGQRNGYTVAAGWRGQGYRGCWVFALGTNDAANVAAGSATGLTARIDQMMAVAHGQPVLWVSTRTELSAGPWSEANERAWDAALTRALARYPNMRVFNWAAVARPGWFLPDGIHYNTAGCAARARAIADALARAFPAGGHSNGKVVR